MAAQSPVNHQINPLIAPPCGDCGVSAAGVLHPESAAKTAPAPMPRRTMAP
jgi:hypothetical protein